LIPFTRFPVNREWLLKLYMLVKSARTVSRELYWEKRVYIGLTSELTVGVATILSGSAKLVFILPAIGLLHNGLKHYILYCLENDNFKTA